MRFRSGFLIRMLSVTAVWSTVCFAQDPGNRDIVHVGIDSSSVDDYIRPNVPIPVFLYNDEELQAVTIPLLVDGNSGWAILDSISLFGGRLADPLVLDVRDIGIVFTDTFSIYRVLIKAELSTGSALPAGTGKLCDLWFRPRFGGNIVIDTTTLDGNLGLALTHNSMDFTPQFTPGRLSIACDYLIGDIDNNGIITSSDLLAMHKELFWHLGIWNWPVGRFDLNCDRHADMRDDVYLIDRIFYSGPAFCPCGSYTAPNYFDPGIRDTLSVSSDTIYVGVPSRLQFNLFNDDSIRAFSFAYEPEGSATFVRVRPSSLDTFDSLSSRVDPSHNVSNGYGAGIFNDICSFDFVGTPVIREGSGPIFFPGVKALTPGTLTLKLVDYDPIDQPPTLLRTPESMLVGYEGNAIIPVFVSGVITVLPICGDADASGVVDISDVVYLINYIFAGGSAPYDLVAGDPDCSGIISVSDAVYLINYVFAGGASPCGACL